MISADVLLKIMIEYIKIAFPKHLEVVPMWHGVDEKGRNHIFSLHNLNSKTKIEAIDEIREIFKEKRIIAYVSCAEGYVLDVLPENVSKFIENGIRNAPGRIEVVSIIAEDYKQMIFADMKINRPINQKPYLSDPSIEKAKEASGRLVGLLPNIGRMQ